MFTDDKVTSVHLTEQDVYLLAQELAGIQFILNQHTDGPKDAAKTYPLFSEFRQMICDKKRDLY